ncbi:hypothetical protein A3B45_00055 [Candidatus Daviesbacteria bacterium RIFCSPLOWO2_01_FULL_39_12]|uniref:POTRA domain-containing protein n=1 Tax=Candidatus Daviesbacteria bacterium RIFCSPLOWO2_01_FULL_39_12 TaxID=1797785 RepID=A0A1F5KP46_9BACT|nr:MAG: hypothetical protein A3B45_00055 [Candidatus Daviesbacteria bacterium RIFCSPLOWO2_01_FULL_39_12]
MLQSKKKPPTIVLLKILLTIFLLVLPIFLTIKTPIFEVKRIDFIGNKLSCVENEQINKELNLYGKNIFMIDFKKGKEDLTLKYSCIGDVQFSKLYPDKLTINLTERKAQFIFAPLKLKEATGSAIEQLINISATESAQFADLGEKYLVDDQGVVFERATEENLPKIYLRYDLSVGKRLDEGLIKNLLKILQKVSEFGLPITRAFLEKEDLVSIDTSPKLVLRLTFEIDSQLAALQLILEKAKIDDVKLEFIDLRFDKPVIRYGERQNNLRN